MYCNLKDKIQQDLKKEKIVSPSNKIVNIKGLNKYNKEIINKLNAFDIDLGTDKIVTYDNEFNIIINDEIVNQLDNILELEDSFKKGIYNVFDKNITDNEGFRNYLAGLGMMQASQSPVRIKPGVEELFDSNPELANAVYQALGFKTTIDNPVYSAVFFNTDEVTSKYKQVHPNLYSHHSTIQFKPSDISNLPIGNIKNIKIVGRLTTDKVDVLIVENSLSTNKFPHITLSTAEGIKPFESNSEIEKNQSKIQPIDDTIQGTVGIFDGKSEITSFTLTLQEKQQAQQLYSQYLDTIFPDSEVKDIVYHGTNAEFEQFKPIKPNFDTLNSIEGIYNFSTNNEFVKRYGKRIVKAIINIRKPIKDTTSGEYLDDMDRPLSEALFKIGKQKNENILAPKYDESLKDVDGVINSITGEEYIAKHPISGKEIGLPKQNIITVFEPKQIHILGGKQDIEGFKKFVENPTLGVVSPEVKDFVNAIQDKVISESPGLQQKNNEIQLANETFKTLYEKQIGGSSNNVLDFIKHPMLFDDMTKALYDFLLALNPNFKIELFDEHKESSALITQFIIKMNRNRVIKDMPEEVAHFFVSYLPEDSELLKQLMDESIEHPLYAQVLRDYGKDPRYQNADGSVNINKIKKEVVGKIIAIHIKNRYNKTTSPTVVKASRKSILNKLVDGFIKFFKKLFGNLPITEQKELTYNQDLYEKATGQILSADLSELFLQKDITPEEVEFLNMYIDNQDELLEVSKVNLLREAIKNQTNELIKDINEIINEDKYIDIRNKFKRYINVRGEDLPIDELETLKSIIYGLKASTSTNQDTSAGVQVSTLLNSILNSYESLFTFSNTFKDIASKLETNETTIPEIFKNIGSYRMYLKIVQQLQTTSSNILKQVTTILDSNEASPALKQMLNQFNSEVKNTSETVLTSAHNIILSKAKNEVLKYFTESVRIKYNEQVNQIFQEYENAWEKINPGFKDLSPDAKKQFITSNSEYIQLQRVHIAKKLSRLVSPDIVNTIMSGQNYYKSMIEDPLTGDQVDFIVDLGKYKDLSKRDFMMVWLADAAAASDPIVNMLNAKYVNDQLSNEALSHKLALDFLTEINSTVETLRTKHKLGYYEMNNAILTEQIWFNDHKKLTLLSDTDYLIARNTVKKNEEELSNLGSKIGEIRTKLKDTTLSDAETNQLNEELKLLRKELNNKVIAHNEFLTNNMHRRYTPEYYAKRDANFKFIPEEITNIVDDDERNNAIEEYKDKVIQLKRLRSRKKILAAKNTLIAVNIDVDTSEFKSSGYEATQKEITKIENEIFNIVMSLPISVRQREYKAEDALYEVDEEATLQRNLTFFQKLNSLSKDKINLNSLFDIFVKTQVKTEVGQTMNSLRTKLVNKLNQRILEELKVTSPNTISVEKVNKLFDPISTQINNNNKKILEFKKSYKNEIGNFDLESILITIGSTNVDEEINKETREILDSITLLEEENKHLRLIKDKLIREPNLFSASKQHEMIQFIFNTLYNITKLNVSPIYNPKNNYKSSDFFITAISPFFTKESVEAYKASNIVDPSTPFDRDTSLLVPITESNFTTKDIFEMFDGMFNFDDNIIVDKDETGTTVYGFTTIRTVVFTETNPNSIKITDEVNKLKELRNSVFEKTKLTDNFIDLSYAYDYLGPIIKFIESIKNDVVHQSNLPDDADSLFLIDMYSPNENGAVDMSEDAQKYRLFLKLLKKNRYQLDNTTDNIITDDEGQDQNIGELQFMTDPEVMETILNKLIKETAKLTKEGDNELKQQLNAATNALVDNVMYNKSISVDEKTKLRNIIQLMFNNVHTIVTKVVPNYDDETGSYKPEFVPQLVIKNIFTSTNARNEDIVSNNITDLQNILDNMINRGISFDDITDEEDELMSRLINKQEPYSKLVYPKNFTVYKVKDEYINTDEKARQLTGNPNETITDNNGAFLPRTDGTFRNTRYFELANALPGTKDGDLFIYLEKLKKFYLDQQDEFLSEGDKLYLMLPVGGLDAWESKLAWFNGVKDYRNVFTFEPKEGNYINSQLQKLFYDFSDSKNDAAAVENYKRENLIATGVNYDMETMKKLPTDKVKIPGNGLIPISEQTRNVLGLILNYSTNMHEYQVKNDMEAIFYLSTRVFEDALLVDEDGNERVGSKRRSSALQEIYDRRILGKISDSVFNNAGLDKVIKTGQFLTRMKMFGKGYQPVVNLIGGTIQFNLLMSKYPSLQTNFKAARRMYKAFSLKMAIQDFTINNLGKNSKSYKFPKEFLIANAFGFFQNNKGMGEFTSAAAMRANIMSQGLFLKTASENTLAALVGLTSMYSTGKVTKDDGTEHELPDIYELDKNNNLVVKDGFDKVKYDPYTGEVAKKVRGIIYRLSFESQGGYNRHGSSMASYYVVGRAYESMSKWFFPIVLSRFGRRKQGDDFLDIETVGNYTLILEMARDIFRILLPNAGNKIFKTPFDGDGKLGTTKPEKILNYLKYDIWSDETNRAALKMAIYETITLLGMYFTITMLLGFDFDDPDKWKKYKNESWLKKYALMIMLKTFGEQGAFLPMPFYPFGFDEFKRKLITPALLPLSALSPIAALLKYLALGMISTLTGEEAKQLYYQKSTDDSYWYKKEGDSKILAILYELITGGFLGADLAPLGFAKTYYNAQTTISAAK